MMRNLSKNEAFPGIVPAKRADSHHRFKGLWSNPCCYIAATASPREIKVGHSSNLRKRLSALSTQAGAPVQTEAAVFVSTKKQAALIERRVQAALKAKMIDVGREWFDASNGEIRAAIMEATEGHEGIILGLVGLAIPYNAEVGLPNIHQVDVRTASRL